MDFMDEWREEHKFCRGSLLPPGHDPPPGADSFLLRPSSCILDLKAYFSNRKNATTASCLARGGRLVQVTFFIAHPPRVSYLCVCCPGESPYEQFAGEPEVVATEVDLVLIRIVFGRHTNESNDRKYDFFIYRAAGMGRAPSLTRILPPKPFIFPQNWHVALLPRYEEEPDLYYIVILHKTVRPYGVQDMTLSSREQQMESLPAGKHCDIKFSIHIYSTKTRSWSSKPTSLVQQHDDPCLCGFDSRKVIIIGGEGGAVAWVDLCRGFLQCDVLKGKAPKLHHVQLPRQLAPGYDPYGDPWVDRDVALIQGRIKFVDLQSQVCPGEPEVLTASTYSRTAADPCEVGWKGGHSIKLDAECVSANPMLLEHLPGELPDSSGTPKPISERLCLCCPMLSLHQDGLVYIMGRIDGWVDNALGLAFDMTKGTLEKVVQVRADRALGILFKITQSQISKYLDMDLGSRAKGKRRGKGKPRKDRLASSSMKSPMMK